MVDNEKEPKETSKQERQREIEKQLRKLGYHGINKSQLARNYDVSRETIYKDLQEIIDNTDINKVERVAYDIHNALQDALTESRKILINPKMGSKNKLQAARTVKDLTAELTEFLEQYGYKEKVADKHELHGDAFQPVPIEVIEPDQDRNEEED